jgi:hypothetical protein
MIQAAGLAKQCHHDIHLKETRETGLNGQVARLLDKSVPEADAGLGSADKQP